MLRIGLRAVAHIPGTVAEVIGNRMHGVSVAPHDRLSPTQVLERGSGDVFDISGANVIGGHVRPRPGAVAGGCDEPIPARGQS